jgi:nucleoside-diphosphate-sugar epimerase
MRHPETLQVLGNGKQRKSYLYVQDCMDAMLLALDRAGAKVNLFNLGTDEYCTVDDSIGWIAGRLAAISHIGLWEQHKGLMVKWMRGMGAVGEIWIWRKALTMGLAGR